MTQSLPTTILSPRLVKSACKAFRGVTSAADGRVQSTAHTSRLTLNFGYSYDLLKKGDRRFVDLPAAFKAARDAAYRQLSAEMPDINAAEDFNNCILSVYGAGDKLEPHVDAVHREGRSFYFGDTVLGVVLIADRSGRFFLQKDDLKRPEYNSREAFHLTEQAGSCFILNGENRKAPIYHGVSEVSEKRVSLTFRTVEFA